MNSCMKYRLASGLDMNYIKKKPMSVLIQNNTSDNYSPMRTSVDPSVYLTSDIYDTQNCSEVRENFGAFSLSAAVRYPYSTSYFYPYPRERVVPGVN